MPSPGSGPERSCQTTVSISVRLIAYCSAWRIAGFWTTFVWTLGAGPEQIGEPCGGQLLKASSLKPWRRRGPQLHVGIPGEHGRPARHPRVDRVDLAQLDVPQLALLVLVLDQEDPLDVTLVAVEVLVRHQHRRAVRVHRLHVERAAPDHRTARVELGDLVRRHLVPDVLRHDRHEGAEDAGVVLLQLQLDDGGAERLDAGDVGGVVAVHVRVRRHVEREDHVGRGEWLAVAPAQPLPQVVGDRLPILRLRVLVGRRVLGVGAAVGDAVVQEEVVDLGEDEVRSRVERGEDVRLVVDRVVVGQAEVRGQVARRVPRSARQRGRRACAQEEQQADRESEHCESVRTFETDSKRDPTHPPAPPPDAPRGGAGHSAGRRARLGAGHSARANAGRARIVALSRAGRRVRHTQRAESDSGTVPESVPE